MDYISNVTWENKDLNIEVCHPNFEILIILNWLILRNEDPGKTYDLPFNCLKYLDRGSALGRELSSQITIV